MINALILLNGRTAGVTKGVDGALALLISVVGCLLVRALRPYAKKRGYAPFSSSQPSEILSEDS